MPIAMASETVLSPSAGFLFTNAIGEVVFADRGFLRLTKRSLHRPPIAEALHATLGIEERSARQFLQDLTHHGSVDRPALSVRTTTGSLRPMRAAGVAVFTGRESYVGADIRLSPPLPGVKSLVSPLTHSDVLNDYARHAFEEARVLKTRTFLQAYLTVHIDAIQVLLARLGGFEVRTALERIINLAASRHGIPASVRDGYLEFEHKTVPLGTYRILLRATVDYAVNAIGRRMVTEEMQTINRWIDPGVLKAAELLGLTIGFGC
ncbi:MAG: hypothetical protein AB1449_09605 [Chloroflexota bacterium]